MEIVVLDGYTENPGDLSWDAVKSFGTLTVYDRTPADDAIICKRIGNADIVITNKTPISAYVIASCPSIKFISVLATGYNVVDTHAAAKAVFRYQHSYLWYNGCWSVCYCHAA